MLEPTLARAATDEIVAGLMDGFTYHNQDR